MKIDVEYIRALEENESLMMKADDSILALIPQGCKVNWNEKQKRFYVFKSSYYYSKEAKRSKEKRTQIGTVVDGVFTYAKSYLMSQELKSLKSEATETKTTVVEKTRKLVDSERLCSE